MRAKHGTVLIPLLVEAHPRSLCADGRKPRKCAALGAAMLHMLTRVLYQAHSFWGHSAALDLWELAAVARRARAAADAAESMAAAVDAAAPEEFTCLQVSGPARAHREASSHAPARALCQVAPGDCRHTALLLGRVGRRATGRVRAYVYEVRATTPQSRAVLTG